MCRFGAVPNSAVLCRTVPWHSRSHPCSAIAIQIQSLRNHRLLEATQSVAQHALHNLPFAAANQFTSRPLRPPGRTVPIGAYPRQGIVYPGHTLPKQNFPAQCTALPLPINSVRSSAVPSPCESTPSESLLPQNYANRGRHNAQRPEAELRQASAHLITALPLQCSANPFVAITSPVIAPPTYSLPAAMRFKSLSGFALAVRS